MKPKLKFKPIGRRSNKHYSSQMSIISCMLLQIFTLACFAPWMIYILCICICLYGHKVWHYSVILIFVLKRLKIVKYSQWAHVYQFNIILMSRKSVKKTSKLVSNVKHVLMSIGWYHIEVQDWTSFAYHLMLIILMFRCWWYFEI